MIGGALALKLLGGLGKLAKFSIPVPIAAIAVIAIWLYFDKASDTRLAVDRAITDLVAGARIDALQATIDGQRRLKMYAEMNAAEAQRRAAAAEAATNDLHVRLTLADIENEGLLNELEARPANPDGVCVVDDALYGRLRNR